MSDIEHDEQAEDEQFGIALGFRIFENAGDLFFVEAEIAPYVDEPESLGVTLVFHPLRELDPGNLDEGVDWPAWPLDIDDDLNRDSEEALPRQFQEIARQLSGFPEDRLRDYLRQARQEAGAG
jgi:hypothetical protein